jgi:GNAT superfamily N-acetyltransferase
MWPNEPFSFVQLPEDPEGVHYGLFVKKVLTAIVSVFTEGKEAQFRKFATLDSQQGKGYGTALINYMIDQLIAKGIEKVWCNARVNKTDFYNRFGMTKTTTTYTKRGIDFVILERTIEKI